MMSNRAQHFSLACPGLSMCACVGVGVCGGAVFIVREPSAGHRRLGQVPAFPPDSGRS